MSKASTTSNKSAISMAKSALLAVAASWASSISFSRNQITLERDQKCATKGDFEQKIMLLWT
ncbi:MAG: hypothetical protein F6K13_23750, partial [Okeania sp. SIO2B9]|nr:hypothetical protein [Okeania sp. SIO2B9]